MTEIATEDDLWKLFFTKPKDHSKRGDGYILWEALNQALGAKSFGDGTKALTLGCKDRFYHIVGSADRHEGSRVEAVVRQCDLRKVARPINRRGRIVVVGYLGTRHPAA